MATLRPNWFLISPSLMLSGQWSRRTCEAGQETYFGRISAGRTWYRFLMPILTASVICIVFRGCLGCVRGVCQKQLLLYACLQVRVKLPAFQSSRDVMAKTFALARFHCYSWTSQGWRDRSTVCSDSPACANTRIPTQPGQKS